MPTIDKEAEFHARIAERDLGALWVGRRGVDLTRPKTPAVPAIWRYAEMEPVLAEAGRLVTAEDAFRRVLVLQNPGFDGAMRATQTLYAGIQVVLPGEIAPCHRHSQTAIRFVIEGEGAVTTVEGEATALHPGDFVVTPYWAWHDHRNRGDQPVVWLDVLDTPLIDALDTVFRENHPEKLQPLMGSDTDGDAVSVQNHHIADMRARLAEIGSVDPWHGRKAAYAHPGGGPPSRTMAAFLQELPPGFAGRPYRSTDGAVFCAAAGSGRAVIEGESFDWRAGDVFVVPGWSRYTLASADGGVLFSVSDRAAQDALGVWREERLEELSQ